MKTLSTLMFVIFSISAAYCQPGSLDVSFSDNGKQTARINNALSEGASVALDTKGRIVVAGNYINAGLSHYGVCRFKQNGMLDHSFGSFGKAELNIETAGNDLYVHAVAVQQDSKVIIVGDDAQGIFSNSYIARVNADGTLDTSFSQASAGGRPTAVAIQSDGKIVVAGHSVWYNPAEREEFVVTRLTTGGIHDSTFGINGETHISFTKSSNTTFDEAYGVVIQPDGKIVVAGTTYGDYSMIAVARLLSDGTLDKKFGKGGKVATMIVGGSNYAEGKAVTLQSDGKILVGGNYLNSDNLFRGVVIRLLTNGSLDDTYGNHGKVLLRFKGHLYHHLNSLAVQPNGKAVVGGYTATDLYDENSRFVLASINTDGTADKDFGDNGNVTVRINASPSKAYGIIVQSDGKIVEAGAADGKFAVVRFLGEDATATINNTPVAQINSKSVDAVNNNVTDIKTLASSVKVYPNPIVNTATISFTAKGKYMLQLSDFSGKILTLETGVATERTTTVALNLSQYAAGVYVLAFTDEQHHTQTFKFYKQ